jgi:hypothetical protein
VIEILEALSLFGYENFEAVLSSLEHHFEPTPLAAMKFWSVLLQGYLLPAFA